MPKLVALALLLFSIAPSPTVAAKERTRPAGQNDGIGMRPALQRGTQAAIWGMPAVSMIALRQSAARDLGAGFNDIIYMSKPPGPQQSLLTPSDRWPCVFAMLNLREGPVVLEIPPAGDRTFLRGTVVDAWQLPLFDVGPDGEDVGRGGRYLFLPPGYDQPVPSGYIIARPASLHLYVSLRPISRDGGDPQQATDYVRSIRAYPLTQAAAPPAGRYIDASQKRWNALPQYDLSYFEKLATLIDEEPVRPRDMVMLGMLSSLGIRKGQPFKPDADSARTLDQAAKDAYVQMQQYFVTPGKALLPHWSERQWQSINFPEGQATSGFPFETAADLLLDQRAGGAYFWQAFLPKRPDAASFDLLALRDRGGTQFNGRTQYRLRILRDMPAGQFWSIAVYDARTKSFFANADRVTISSSQRNALKVNNNGSIDLYFGPRPPDGPASNWIPTGDDFFLWFRFYGANNAAQDKTWKLQDVDPIK